MSNRPFSFHLLLTSLILLHTADLRSQESAAIPVVTLKTAFDAAIQKTETLPIAATVTERAGERKSQARGAIFPSIALNGTYTKQDAGGANSGLASTFTNSEQYNARFTATQPLFR